MIILTKNAQWKTEGANTRVLFFSSSSFLLLRSLKFSHPRINLYSAHNDLLSFIIIESFKARSGFFVPIKPGFVSPIKTWIDDISAFSLLFSSWKLIAYLRFFLASLSYQNYLRTRLSGWTKWKCEFRGNASSRNRNHRAFQSLSENAARESQTMNTRLLQSSALQRKASRLIIIFIIKYRTLP